MIRIIKARDFVSQDIIEQIGSLAIIDIIKRPGAREDIILDSSMVKIAYDSEALHILRFELTETRHCIIDNFRFGKLVIS